MYKIINKIIYLLSLKPDDLLSTLYYQFNKIFNKDFRDFINKKICRNENDVLKQAYILKNKGIDNLHFLRIISVTVNDYDDDVLSNYFSVRYFEKKICELTCFLGYVENHIIDNGLMEKGTFDLSYKSVIGNENLGSILLNCDGKSYFGKISLNNQNKKEVAFYKSVKAIGSSYIVNVLFSLNLEKYDVNIMFFDSLPKNGFLNKGEVPKVLELYNNIESELLSTDIIINAGEFYKKPYSYGVRYKFFSKMIVEELKTVLSVDDYLYINHIFIENKLYKSIEDKHFDFVHNDFHWKNLNINSDSIKVFDFNSYCTGLKTWDLATYFSTCNYSFDETIEFIKENLDLLNDFNTKNHLSVNYFVLFYVFLIKLRFNNNVLSYQESNIEPSIAFLKWYNKNVNC
ncbi:hypothetical protein JK628_08190 [Shewanella sp. KX20019]|uniref:hypothetical protein n=1 Tax=Shewanella sp. KX20019 TaxID=2803864 RepID=UPI001926CABB|nr:hypothetical protein [Shewanella sp. KX20019]QQX81799.1 hypothetical protein JK628_08190 [Shewanella sp. KX20019]